ncbi:hypothetical protein AB6A40_010929 [Gnathostoma spinigerum]|uniref:Uncharacterized protein n=1 Tax=Gnathostoma spinigerum TaxID=75299 RepID=A0ABD6EXN9_9BILA
MLHDLPLTITTYFFLTSCRCPGPQIRQWPMIMIAITTTVNVVWRLVMVYFAYRRMICPLESGAQSILLNKEPTIFASLQSHISLRNISDQFIFLTNV